MRLRASPMLLGGASLLSMGMPGTRGLLPGPSVPHRLERVPSSSSRSQHRRSSAGCLCRRHMAVGCGCFSNTKTQTNTNAHGGSDGAATTAPSATTTTTAAAAVAPGMRATCEPHLQHHRNRLLHQEDAAAAAPAPKTSSVLRRKQAEPQHQLHHQHHQQQQQRPSKPRSEQFSRPRAVNRRHTGRGVVETSTPVSGGGGGGDGNAAAKALASASRARRGGNRAVRGGGVELEVGGGGNEEETGWGERRMGGVVGVGSHSAFQNLRESVAGLPRLSRQEETSLANDVRRWQRLERVREEVSRQGAGSKGGARGGGVGVEAWAMAAGMSVTDLRLRVEKGAGARERLVLSHVRLVMYLARRRGWSTALSPMDLVQEGTIALHAAVDKYDPTRGVRFFTYADWALRAAFEQAEADQSGAVPLPRYVHVQKRRLKAVIRQETALRLRSPTREELATALDITEAQVGRLLRWLDGCDSTDRPLATGGSLGEMIPGPNAFESDMRRLDAEAELGRLLGELKPQEEQVILHRYGLFGRGRKSTLAIAAIMGVSRQYVGRVHQSALVKMRVSFEEKSSSSSRGGSSSSNNSGISIDSIINSNNINSNNVNREDVFNIYTQSSDHHHQQQQQSRLQLEPELGR